MHKSFKIKTAVLCIPAFIGFFVFYILPFFKSIAYSFMKSSIDHTFVRLDNYKAVLSNEIFLMALKNTVIFSLISVTLAVIIALIISLALVKLSEKWSFLKAAFIMPYVLPSASIIFIWRAIFSTDTYYALSEIESLTDFFDILPLYLLFIWKNIGICIILITAAIIKVNPEVYDAAAVDGSSGLHTHIKITLSMISPSLFFVIVLSFVNSLKIFKESYLFYNTNYPPDVAYMVQNYMNNHFYKLNYQNLSCAVVIFTFVLGLIIFALYRLENKLSDYT